MSRRESPLAASTALGAPASRSSLAATASRRHPAINAARRAVLCLAALALGAATLVAARGQLADTDPLTSLAEGNRLFRNGEVEAAIDAYTSGYSPAAPHPTLLYNLATALHHVDRLPEAILWYRRGADAEDPWLEENLWLARRSLGSQVMQPGGSLGWLTRHADHLRLAAIVLGWLSLLLMIALPRMPLWGLAASAAVAFLLYGGAAGVDRWGPRPAVVLSDCYTEAGELPAGTEAWVRPSLDGRWAVSGSVAVCDPDTVELVFPGA